MPNPLQPPPPLLGLQKAQSIGADPRAEAFRAMDNSRLEASVPNPENKGMGALDALSKLARNYSGPVQETLGELNPFHTPVGGEGMFNTSRMAPNMAPSVEDSIYQRMMEKFGMGRK